MAARFDWESIRAEYEVGASQSDLSKRYGVSRTAIQKRIRAEGWVQDISGTVNRMAEAKVAGVVAACNPQKKAEALDRAAEAKAAVITRHQREWDRHQALIDEALSEGSFDKAKLAKITAETIKIRQEESARRGASWTKLRWIILHPTVRCLSVRWISHTSPRTSCFA